MSRGREEGEARRYWTSLEDREGRDVRASEFRFGALDPPDEISRRSVLKLLGASAALAGATGCRPVEHIVPYVDYPEGVVPGVPRYYATTLPRGTDAVGVVVESHEGRPNKIEGNPLHPSSLGAASAQIQAAILDLYDPDRAGGFLREGEPATRDDLVAAWGEISGGLPGDGSGLAVLVAGHSSPTLTRLTGELQSRYAGARIVFWDAVSDGNIFEGHAGHRPVYHLDRADVLVTLDCDLLHSEGNALANARGWSRGRSRLDEGMSRLYAIESTLSPTGASADHRLALPSHRIGAFLAAVASELGEEASGFGEIGESVRDRATLVAADLRRAGDRAVITVGRRQRPEVHALAYRILHRLGAVGSTVTLHPTTDLAWGRDDGLRELVEVMAAGEITTLVVLGGNPVYSAPGGLDLPAALGSVGTSIRLGAYRDETSALCTWHVPEAHALEAWGDARAADGTPGVVQPLIEPLHGGVSAVELVGLMTTGEWRPGSELVRETWEQLLGVDEATWNQVLHDGVLTGGSLPAVDLEPGTASTGSSGGQEGLELVWLPSSTTWDGSQSNNAWLQEAPDPISKLSWDNAALVAPGTAAELEVETQGQLTLRWEEREVTLPVIVLPGQAEGSIAVDLGYGRSAAGRVGNGLGVDINPLRAVGDSGFVVGVTAQAAGSSGDKLVFTQEQWDLQDRPLIREADLEEYRQHPAFAQEPDAGLEFPELYPRFDYSEGPQWGMTIDLNACSGCMACVTACQSENNIPVVGKEQIDRGREMLWLRVDRYFSGDPESPQVAFQPVPCMHCENAPCEQVCPVAATVHSPDGLNLMVYNRCIGTRYCSNNCPYKVRRFNFFNFTKDTPELAKMAMNPDVTVRSRGVMEKCTYCIQRISEGRRRVEREGRDLADGDVLTACQQTCPTQAITFGDVSRADSAVSERKADPRNYTILTELANFPRTSYLARVRNPNPAWEES